MKRLMLSLLAALCSALLIASPVPPPTPARTPTPTRTGPILDVTFSGIFVFRKADTGYRAVIPARHAHQHQPYLLFLSKGATVERFDRADFKCGNEEYSWVPLTADVLTIAPANVIEAGPLNADPVKEWLVHLGKLASNPFNDDDYNQKDPVVGKVAAQIDIDRGTLQPFALDDPQYSPVRWGFEAQNGTISTQTVCGPAGISWLLPIRQGTLTIQIVSSLKKHPRVILPLANGEITRIIVGNSLSKDIQCPAEEPAYIDHHFKLHYKVLEGPVATEFIPYRIVPVTPCPTPAGTMRGNRSLRGSNCLGTQWP